MALVAMLAAGLSQWCSVNQLVLSVGGTMPKQLRVTTPTPPALAKKDPATPPVLARTTPTTNPASEKFFETLVSELKTLKQQNQELKDQVAETNRDMMEVQFRLDSHSESFRPLKVAPEPDTTHDDGPGVLPPRALPADEEESLGQ